MVLIVSLLVAEAIALREAIIFASTLSLQKIVLESDCLDLIDASRGDKVRGEIELIIKDINEIKKNFTWRGFLWTNHDGNKVADMLVKLAASNLLPRN